ncbi:MAG: FlgD immunoglobulin-like domain containing protein [Armatimonadota bacterium]
MRERHRVSPVFYVPKPSECQGTYTDSITYRSKYLSTNISVSYVSTDDNNTPANPNDDTDNYNINYTITDSKGRDASTGYITIYGPDGSTVQTISSIDVSLGSHSTTYQMPASTTIGKYTAVLFALDNDAVEYRDHQPRWAYESGAVIPITRLSLLSLTETGGIIPVKLRIQKVNGGIGPITSITMKEKEDAAIPIHTSDWIENGGATLESSNTEDGITTEIWKWNWNSATRDSMGQSLVHNENHKIQTKTTIRVNGTLVDRILEEDATVNNLVITNVIPETIINWKGEEGTTVPITATLTDNALLTRPMNLTLKIYNTKDDNRTTWLPVRTMTKTNVTGGQQTFHWDGKNNNGDYVEPWTYTFEIEAAQPQDYDWTNYRSPYLRITRATDTEGNAINEAEYAGYDDNDTPEDETDDNYEYYIRFYTLTDSLNTDASEGQIELVGPQFTTLGTWSISSLECLEHKASDGLHDEFTILQYILA